MARVKVPVSFSYTTNPTGATPTYLSSASGSFTAQAADVVQPVQNTTVTITVRSTGLPATVYQTETGSATYTSLVTDAGGAVPGWVNEGSYTIVAAAQGAFSGATYYFDATRGDGVSNIAAGVVGSTQLASSITQALLPSGAMLDFAGPVAPTGFLLCDGNAYSRSTYASLFSAIGTVWGGGDGSTTFNVPDFRGLVSVGAGVGSGLTSRTVGPRLAGIAGGEETHKLLAAESGTNGKGSTGNDSPDHTHQYIDPAGVAANSGASIAYSGGAGWTGNFPQTGGASTRHQHALIARNADSDHNNLQPFAVSTRIIKT